MGFEGKNPKSVILEKDQDLEGLSPALAVRCVLVSGYEMPSLRDGNTLGPASTGAMFDVINLRSSQAKLPRLSFYLIGYKAGTPLAIRSLHWLPRRRPGPATTWRPRAAWRGRCHPYGDCGRSRACLKVRPRACARE